ncbi:hypothetical protein KTC92_04110 [Clostridium sp. CM027]|nr:hypothetical protein [Clostridium sp. CM027]MBW9146157.1 hypothetical protein [Clostridium sp. CM027]UVE41669.1 hypothetical protein KTC92_04110 [Clostridium sp. CM027]
MNKIIEQGNKDNDNIDLAVIAEIEKYMENHIKCDFKLDYNLVSRLYY